MAPAFGADPVLPLFVALAVLGTRSAAIDIACQRLPTRWWCRRSRPAPVLLAVLAAVDRQWGSLGRALLGAVALGAVYFLLHLAPGRPLGFGDVKLAVLLGLFLGWLGWREVVWGALLPWLVNVPVVLVVLLTGRAERKSGCRSGRRCWPEPCSRSCSRPPFRRCCAPDRTATALSVRGKGVGRTAGNRPDMRKRDRGLSER